MTLFVCGFVADAKRFDDDCTVDELERQLWELKEARLAPFEVEVGGVNSFETAPFLEIFDVAGGIERVRNLLSGTYSEIRQGVYVPHLTLGLYSGCFDTKVLAEKMSSFHPDTRVVHCVDEIRLMSYSAFEITGPLTVKYAVHLGAT